MSSKKLVNTVSIGIITNIETVKEFIVKSEEVDLNTKDKYGSTPLHLSAYAGHKEIVELLIKNNADLSVKDKDGAASLHYAAAGGQMETTGFLISKGADVNLKNKIYETPLDAAIDWGDSKTADLLRKHGGKTGEELKAEGK